MYLVDQVPGLAIASIGDGWLTMALGEPGFTAGEEKFAQQFMRRHGLDQQHFPDLHSAVAAVFSAWKLEPGL